jgi:hypothetical protein
MTIESGSKRHTGDQVTDKVLAAQGHGPWETHRQPDAVRAAALANAVDCCRWLELLDAPDPAERILDIARTFEGYLDPAKEADDPTHP